MTKSKTLEAALAALTLATTFIPIGGQAQAHPHFRHGYGLGVGRAAGTLIGIAAATSGPAYVAPGYTESGYVSSYDRWRRSSRSGRPRDVEPCSSEFNSCGRRSPPSTLAPIDLPSGRVTFCRAVSRAPSTAANSNRARPASIFCHAENKRIGSATTRLFELGPLAPPPVNGDRLHVRLPTSGRLRSAPETSASSTAS